MRSCPAGLFSQLQSDDLLVEHYIFLFYDHVLMVVAEKPVFELAPLAYLIEELRQGILLIKPAAEYVLHTGGTAVGDDVVHLPARSVQAGLGGLVLCLAG